MAARKKKGAIRENVESFGVAIAAALLIRWAVIEPFKIPTGSMAPTLAGTHRTIKCPNCGFKFKLDRNLDTAICTNCLAHVDAFKNRKWKGDRILVWKFIYHMVKPRRWDVIVFLYPFADVKCKTCGYFQADAPMDIERCPECGSTNLKREKKNFIKRLIGLPGEQVFVAGGDVFINGKIARKPDRVQKQLWLPVYDMAFKPKEIVREPWVARSGQWQLGSDKLACKARPGEAAEVEFNRRVTDRVSYQGGGANYQYSSDNVVRDLRVEFDASWSAEVGYVDLVLGFGGEVFRAVVPVGTAGGKCRLLRAGKVVREADAPGLAAGERHRFSLTHADAGVDLWLDGKHILRYEYDVLPDRHDAELASNRVAFGIDAGEAEFTSVRVARDVYYQNGQNGLYLEYACREPLQLTPDQYFVLGDNSPNSKDSRMWRSLPKKNLLGRAFVVFWPFEDAKMLRGYDGLE